MRLREPKRFFVYVACAFLLSAAQLWAKPCHPDLALLAGNPTFVQLAERVLASSASTRSIEGADSRKRLNLTPGDVEGLFSDAKDPWMQRMMRFITSEMRSGSLLVDLVGDAKTTGSAAGTCRSASCGADHQIQILLDKDLMAGNPTKNGIRAAARATLVHEAMHARINEHLIKWLERNYLAPENWVRRLDTSTEEFVARIADQRALGRSEINAKLRAWFSTFMDAGTLVNPWTDLESAWKQKLKVAGIDLDAPQAREQRRVEWLAQQERNKQSLEQSRKWTEQDFATTPGLKTLRESLTRKGRIKESQWNQFRSAVTQELYRSFGKYGKRDLILAIERNAPSTLGIRVKCENLGGDEIDITVLGPTP